MRTESPTRKGMKMDDGAGGYTVPPAAGFRNRQADAGHGSGIRNLTIAGLLFALVLVIWLNEFIDMPRLFFGVAPTPVNWQEAMLETFIVLLAAGVVWRFASGVSGQTEKEKQLLEHQKFFSEVLIRESPTYCLAVKPDGSIITVNNALLNKTGYSFDEVVGGNCLTLFIPPRERETIARDLADIVLSGKPRTRVSNIVTRTGEECVVQWEAAAACRPSGELDFIYAAGIDITEQKKTERALKLSEERYRSFVQNLQGVAYQLDMNLRPVFLHGDIQKLTGYSKEEILSGSVVWEDIIAPEDVSAVRIESHKARSIPNYAGEVIYRIIRKDGGLRWVQEYFRNICDENAAPSAVQGIVYDITAAKEAEESLRRSEERYRLLADNMKDVIWAFDRNMRYTYISPSVERARGYTVEEAMSLPVEKIFTESSYQKFLKILSEVKILEESKTPPSPGQSLTFELELVCKDGKTVWTEITACFAYDSQGRPAGYVGMTRDVTERKRAQEAIQQREDIYRTIFESTGTAMIIIDEDTTISLANSEFVHLSGYPREEIENRKSWKMFVAAEDVERMARYHVLRRRPGHEAPRNYSFRFKDRYGIMKDMFVTATLLPGTNKSLISLLDITETKKAEEELRISREQIRNLHKHSQDVRERERARIAREIHDELGQVLTALKMDLSFLAKKLPPDLSSLETKVNLMLRFVDMTIQSVKRITMDLRPGLLDHLGLVAAIEWQAEEFQKRTGIRCSVTVDPDEIILRPDQSTSVFRIFQETLTNIARHARATEVRTSLTVKDGILEMTVRDNGIGITNEQIENPKSYGLMGIKERAYFCGGEAGIFGQKGKGTTVVITIPFDEMRIQDDTSACG